MASGGPHLQEMAHYMGVTETEVMDWMDWTDSQCLWALLVHGHGCKWGWELDKPLRVSETERDWGGQQI